MESVLLKESKTDELAISSVSFWSSGRTSLTDQFYDLHQTELS